MKSLQASHENMRAWVVFSGESDLRLLKILKPGFRHCFVLLNDGQCWLSVDPMAHNTEIVVHHLSADFDLPRWLEKRGHVVVPAYIDAKKTRPAPFGVFSCVEAVKRVLGVHALFIFTPWQLYCHLTKPSNTKEIIHGKSNLAA
ncbi:MAG: hypothetical protein ACLFR0_03320 [Alphaproteobacteria bacterium]